jgi:hypothetical protein
MKIFLYVSAIEGKGKEIQGIMKDLFLDEQLQIHRSINSLSQNLQEPWEEKPIVVVLIYRKDELIDLVSKREQLYQVRLVLILPESEEGMISLAHRLRPNYLTYIHKDLKDLKAVLLKMSEMN